MKVAYTTILVIAVTALMWPGIAVAEDTGQMGHGWGHRSRDMRGQWADRILDRIEESDPEKAEELRLLREEDPGHPL